MYDEVDSLHAKINRLVGMVLLGIYSYMMPAISFNWMISFICLFCRTGTHASRRSSPRHRTGGARELRAGRVVTKDPYVGTPSQRLRRQQVKAAPAASFCGLYVKRPIRWLCSAVFIRLFLRTVLSFVNCVRQEETLGSFVNKFPDLKGVEW